MQPLRDAARTLMLAVIGGNWPVRREEGQTLVEYALVLFLIAVVVVVAIATVGGQAKRLFANVASSI